MGFTRNISEASSDVISTSEEIKNDGTRILTTNYKNGIIETIYYYPDGEYQRKETAIPTSETYYTREGDSRHYTPEEIEKIIKKEYNSFSGKTSVTENAGCGTDCT